MKKLGLLLVFAAFAVCSNAVAHGADTRRDGNWWLGLTPTAKLYFAVGFFDGIELGSKFSYWGMTEGKNTDCAGKAVGSFYSYKKKYLADVTNDQIVDGLDSFYSDYKNRRILIPDAVWLVANGIAGTPQKDLDKMIESWRKNATAD